MISQENIQFLISVITLLGIIFAVYKTFRDPDIETDKELALLKQKFEMRQGEVDKDIRDIKINHLAHIEKDIMNIKETQIKILTILKERNDN